MEGDPIMSVRFFLFLVVATVQLVATQAWAQPKQLKGSQFVTAMKSNTLSATSRAGVKFKAYFLAGGSATYEDENGIEDHGQWRIKNGDQVCIVWKQIEEGLENCARIYAEGDDLIWKGDNISGEGRLLGGVR
jgi:hypothetical protein